MEGRCCSACCVDDDPGRDLGERPGHRFFFAPAEVEPLARRAHPRGRHRQRLPRRRRLRRRAGGAAGAARRCRRASSRRLRDPRHGPRLRAGRGYDVAVLLDAAPRGERARDAVRDRARPRRRPPDVDAHGMDPVKVLALARALGGPLPRTLVRRRASRAPVDEEELVAELSAPVQRGARRGGGWSRRCWPSR